jgi:hypothetical protein
MFGNLIQPETTKLTAEMQGTNITVVSTAPSTYNVTRSSSPTLYVHLGTAGVIIPMMLFAYFYGIVKLSPAYRARNQSSPPVPSDGSSEATLAFIVSVLTCLILL